MNAYDEWPTQDIDYGPDNLCPDCDGVGGWLDVAAEERRWFFCDTCEGEGVVK